MRKKLKGFWELRWRSCKKQHRLIGYFVEGDFAIVIGCTHKDQIYDPPNALKSALERKRRVEKGEGSLVRYAI